MISFTVKNSNNEIDLLLDENQIIGSVLMMLKNAGKLPDSESYMYCRSEMQKRVISISKSFREERI